MTKPTEAIVEVSTPSETLREVRELFRVLETSGILYCHWKSNEHLGASLRGCTDLDVLVDWRAAPALARALATTSFRQLSSLPHRGYPGIESYVGMDHDTGVLLHFHLHYRLTVGERHLKSYRLPWEDLVLSTRVLDEASGIYVVDPNLEYVLLIVRAALKVRIRERLRAALGRNRITGELLREFRWLAERVDPHRLASLGRGLLGDKAASLLVAQATGDPPTVKELLEIRDSAEPSFSAFRTYGAPAARLRRWFREAHRPLAEGLRRSGFVVPTRRTMPQGGLIVAFVGVDGSGKSTIAAETTRWLSGLVDVVPIYMGSGSGPGSISRRFLEFVAAAVRRVRKGRPPAVPEGPRRGHSTSTLRTIGEILWFWALSRERERKAAKARRAQNRGMIVICDRFPQSQVAGNDGPQLAHWMQHSSSMCRATARRELAALRSVERLAPDLMVKLDVPAETSMRRKPDTPPAMVHSKIRALKLLRELGALRTVEVDATRPYDEVLLEVKRLLWGTLGHC
jgi:thymidylate kinase